MAGIIGHILPIAVGVALSSVPIVVMVLILLSPRGRWSSLTYLIGAAIGLAGLTTLFSAVASLLPPPPPSNQSPLFAAIEIVIGLALLVLAAVRWTRGRARIRAARAARSGVAADLDPDAAPASATGMVAWLTKVTSLGPIPSFGVGFILMLRPKNLLLTLAAGVAIGAGNVTVGLDAVAITIFTLLGISTLAAPIIFSLVDPARMKTPLERTRVWIEGNSATVTTIVLLVLGVVIIGSGITHL